MSLIPCPRCKTLCSEDTAECQACGCAVKEVTSRRARQVRLIVISLIIFFILMLANSVYWASRM